MNTGQMMLTTLAIVLLGMTVLTVSRTNNQHGQILEQTEVGIYGMSLATSIVEEAQGLAFDEKTVDNAVTNVSGLSTTLGAETGETTSPVTTNNFDDFDDYNNLDMPLTITGVDQFRIRAQVYYVVSGAPNTKSTTPTWHKRLDVQVTGSATADTIKSSFVFSYFNFR